MTYIIEIFLAVLLVSGGIFSLTGSFGLLRLRNTIQRLHSPTLITTLGIGLVLIASMIYFPVFQEKLSWQELLVALFLFLSAPISTNFIAKTQMHLSVKPHSLPQAGQKVKWATYDP